MCTKPCVGPIISRINKWITGFCFYPLSETEYNKLKELQKFEATEPYYGRCIMWSRSIGYVIIIITLL